MIKRAQRLGLGDVGTLPDGERAVIKEWLLANFCSEDTFECELHELEGGGFSLDDAAGGLAADDDAFGVHILEGKEGEPSFLVVLFEDLPQGIMVDRRTLEIVGAVIEGDIVEVTDGYEKYMPAICKAVAVLR
jgi:hypothetical protein